MNYPDYQRSDWINDLQIPVSATIVGTGGTGAWVALFAALAGCSNLVLFDRSSVRATDIARLPIEPNELGKSKVEAVKNTILRYRPDCQVNVYKRKFIIGEDESLITGVLFNCADDMQAARYLAEYSSIHDIRYVTAPYAGLAAAVYNYCPENHFMSGKPEPTWIGSCTLAAALAVTSAFGKSFNTIVCPTRSDIPKSQLEEEINLSMFRASL
jgi:molybdopterin/thiamine biosynthesis adenylyltransferase